LKNEEPKKENHSDKFIILPNAMYGNWVQSMNLINDPRQVSILLYSMLRDFNIKLYENTE